MSYFRVYINDKSEAIKSELFSSIVKLIVSDFDIPAIKNRFPIITIGMFEHNGKVHYEIYHEIDEEFNYIYVDNSAKYRIKNTKDLIDWIATQTHYMKLRKMLENSRD